MEHVPAIIASIMARFKQIHENGNIACYPQFIDLQSAALVTVFARNLVRAYQFYIIEKTAQ